ncbi:MAG: 3-isopropylmalate dehydratase [Candidatus Thermoplasmatota archaeon]|nr:3-isopropylmalate dehydratase [Candidatus Thermoplasmatota archaeon]
MRVWRYGDNVNTDMLFPGKYTYTCSKPEEIMPHLLEDLDPDFSSGVKKGDLLLVGSNFGCGSSREQPVLGLKHAGIEAIIGRSFARIFYRAAINQGLILIECPSAVDAYKDGDEVILDIGSGRIEIGGEEHRFPPLPDAVLAIRDSGGLLEYTRKRLEPRKG